MPVKGIYLDDETYKRLEARAALEGRGVGEIAGETLRIEASKRESDETRPKTCPKCKEEGKGLEWHLTGGEFAELYCLCLSCGWRFDTAEVYRTRPIG
jgi:DNA-directed RNA polymerase subunit M/transcription elongation factor TFIIS